MKKGIAIQFDIDIFALNDGKYVCVQIFLSIILANMSSISIIKLKWHKPNIKEKVFTNNFIYKTTELCKRSLHIYDL